MLEIAPDIIREAGACVARVKAADTRPWLRIHTHSLFMRGCGVALLWGRCGPVCGHRSLLPNQRLGDYRASNMALLCFQPHLSCLVYALGQRHVYRCGTNLVRFLGSIYLSPWLIVSFSHYLPENSSTLVVRTPDDVVFVVGAPASSANAH